MLAPRALYRLLAWLSPGFPTGGFSFSHGLEQAVGDGAVTDRASLVDWLEGVIGFGAGALDVAHLRAVHRAETPAELERVIERAAVWRGTAELAHETAAQGEAFLRTARAAWPDARFELAAAAAERQGRPMTYPVAVGVAARAAGLDAGTAALAYLHALAANLVSAGVRLIPLGQTDGQRALAALEPCVIAAAAREDVPLGTATAAIDLASMRHETQYTRLFRT